MPSAILKPSSSAPLLGTVLVTGGSGFLGTEIVSTLSKDPSCSKIIILDRVIKHSNDKKVTYIEGSITNYAKVREIIEENQPRVIFHAASPNFTFPINGYRDYWNTNVNGTSILLGLAEHYGVEAFVFSSATDFYAGSPHDNIDETHAKFTSNDKSDDYQKSKALADSIVLAANSPEFKTVSLRMTHLYGDGDSQAIPAALNACAGNKKLFQIGQGKNLFDVLSTRNAADAQILAAKALLDPSRADGKVDGEAFHVSDGSPVRFWYFFTLVWSVARGHDVQKELTIIPAWVIWVLVNIMEWIYFIFTLGMVQPEGVDRFQRSVMEYCLYSNTFNSEKFNKRLKFKPILDFDDVMKHAVTLELARRKRLGMAEKKVK